MWSTAPALPSARTDLAAYALGTELHIVGGYNPSGNYDSLAGHLLLNIAAPAPQWSAGLPLMQDRGDLCAAVSPSNGEPVVLPVLPRLLQSRELRPVDAGEAFVYGGFASNNWEQALASPESLRPNAAAWSTLTPPPDARKPFRGDAACAVAGGTFYVVGGEQVGADGVQVVLPTIEAYDPAVGAWRALAPMSEERFRFAAASDGAGCIYVTGGQAAQRVTQLAVPWDTPAAVLAADNTVQADAGARLSLVSWLLLSFNCDCRCFARPRERPDLRLDCPVCRAATEIVLSWAEASSPTRQVLQLPDQAAFDSCDLSSAVMLPASSGTLPILP